jgi:hypothetical protein
MVGLFYCLLFRKVWFVIWFEKIVMNNFSRPKGARRAAYREVGCNPSRRAHREVGDNPSRTYNII